jgi:hypothetical protein
LLSRFYHNLADGEPIESCGIAEFLGPAVIFLGNVELESGMYELNPIDIVAAQSVEVCYDSQNSSFSVLHYD